MFQHIDYSNTEFSIESYLTNYSHLTDDSYHALHIIEDIDEPIVIPFNISDPESIKVIRHYRYSRAYLNVLIRLGICFDSVSDGDRCKPNLYIYEWKHEFIDLCGLEHLPHIWIQLTVRCRLNPWSLSEILQPRSNPNKIKYSLTIANAKGWSDERLFETRNNSPLIHLIVLVTAIALIILNMRYFYKLGMIYMNMKMNYQKMIKQKKRSFEDNIDPFKSMVTTRYIFSLIYLLI